jgi:type III secretion protein J
MAAARRLLRRLVSGLTLIVLCACSQVVNLQTGLREPDANEIVALLMRNGIEARKLAAKEGITLTVRETDVPRATELMRAAGLPKRSLATLGTVFKKEGMISTPLEERVRYIHALSEELEFTLQQFDNVVSARVHVVLPERVAPGEPIQPSSAAVFVKYNDPFDEDANIPRIANLVASSIPGLSGAEGRSKVSVVLAPAGVAAKVIEWESVGPFKVQGESAGSLLWALTGMAVLCGISLLTVLILLLGRTAWGRKMAGQLPIKRRVKAPAT